jgi:hypothetical protein
MTNSPGSSRWSIIWTWFSCQKTVRMAVTAWLLKTKTLWSVPRGRQLPAI